MGTPGKWRHTLINTDYLFRTVARVLVLFACIPAHECAHGWMADKLGDDTAKQQGRLTLNPFRHFDFLGTVTLILLGFGWAKPVPVDMRKFKNPKKGMALTALAGPAANLVMGTVLLLALKIFFYAVMLHPLSGSTGTVSVAAYSILSMMVSTNVTLAVFNLIPINPLDGSRILGAFLPDRVYFFLMKYERVIYAVLLLALLTGLLDFPLSWLSGKVLQGLDFLTGFVDLLARLFL